MFKDEATVKFSAGRGGDGCVSFRREYRVPRGGPDGGDGGDGGDVMLYAAHDVTSLLDLVRKRKVRADPGQPGLGSNCNGRNGGDTRVPVPVGTSIFDAESGELLADLVEADQEYLAAHGGRGGRGNKAFASATHQTPREFEQGSDGQQRTLRLELKLIADVGLVGLPNAGKSTLLSRCSAARPKIAAYPFTTLEPQLGIVSLGGATLVMADIPGLIEGASEGKGLGHQFLRHIERTRVILHMLDAGEGDAAELAASYRVIRRELEHFSPVLAAKEEIVAVNKIDTVMEHDFIGELSRELGCEIFAISAATGENLPGLIGRLFKIVTAARAAAISAPTPEASLESDGEAVPAEA